jgi:hypothetical protein
MVGLGYCMRRFDWLISWDDMNGFLRYFFDQILKLNIFSSD